MRSAQRPELTRFLLKKQCNNSLGHGKHIEKKQLFEKNDYIFIDFAFVYFVLFVTQGLLDCLFVLC